MILYSYTRGGEDLLVALSSLTCSLFPQYNRDGFLDDELVLITREHIQNNKKSIPDYWKNIQNAWNNINSNRAESQLKNWRMIWDYGEEIVPGLGVYRFRGSSRLVYFYLLQETDPYLAGDKLNNLFCILSAWQHLKRGKGFYHASGIFDPDSAYVFIGQSGAGKTTVSNFSDARGFQVIHDDHVVVYPDEEGNFRVTDRTLSLEGILLKSIFFLHQDTVNRLVSLSRLKTARKVFEGCLDSVARRVLHGEFLENAFRISADIARRVPGYNLYFKKSPDFWDLIHDELGNH